MEGLIFGILRYFLFSIGSSNSGTTLHGGDGGGKAINSFCRRMSESKSRRCCPISTS